MLLWRRFFLCFNIGQKTFEIYSEIFLKFILDISGEFDNIYYSSLNTLFSVNYMGYIHKTRVFLCLIAIISLSLGGLVMVNNASAEPDKEYRAGQIISVNGKNYLIAINKEFAEIIEITADNKLFQASEVHGAKKIESLYAGRWMNKYFLIIATGQFLYRYDISNPAVPRIEFKRDLYAFKRGQFKIGFVGNLAGNSSFLFGAGSNGVRSFVIDNLFVNKIYTFNKAYGLAADEKNLAVITENKGAVYDIASGAKLIEVDLENKDKLERTPAFDNSGNAYFPTDRGLVKINTVSQGKKLYLNPVPKTDNFSYGATDFSDGSIYYINGHGITVLDNNFNKTKFLNTTKPDRFGANSWSVGITAAKIGAREIIADFNKSSIILLDKNLKVLSQYKYKKLYSNFITADLKIAPSVSLASPGQNLNLRLYGFWPNETVTITFGKNNYSIKVDNQGYASDEITVPQQNSKQAIIQATGSDSKFNYQTVFTIL